MTRFCFPALLLLLNGCFACGTGSHVQDVDPELKVYRPAAPALDERHSSNRLDAVAPGAWIAYRVSKDGNDASITWGAVRTEGNSLWVEVVEEGDPRMVSLRKITFEGEVLSGRYQEIPASGPASEVADQPVSPGGDAPRIAPARTNESKKTIKVGERNVEATVCKKLYRDESVGREYEEEEAWSAEAPPILEYLEIGGKPAGLVYRKSATGSVMAIDWGTGYTTNIK